jgi:hypothetical protein
MKLNLAREEAHVREGIHFSLDVLLHEIIVGKEEALDGDVQAEILAHPHLAEVTLTDTLLERQFIKGDLPACHLALLLCPAILLLFKSLLTTLWLRLLPHGTELKLMV